MGVLTHNLNETAEIIGATKNPYGDRVIGSRTTVACRFRYITQLDKQNYAEGISMSDAIIWFEPTAPIEEDTIVKTSGKFWRVETLVRAKGFRGGVLFLKAFVKKEALADGS